MGKKTYEEGLGFSNTPSFYPQFAQRIENNYENIFFHPPPPPPSPQKIFFAEFPGSTENSFLRWLCFCSEFFALVGKRLDKKTKVNFKMYDVIDWETNNYTTHSDQYLKK